MKLSLFVTSFEILIVWFNLKLLLADDVKHQLGISNEMVAVSLLNWKTTLDDESRNVLSSWVGEDPCKNWFSISCDNNNRTVTSISLESLRLQGTLDHFNFSALGYIQNFSIYNNLLSGFIPAKFRYMRNLRNLNLSRNQLTGRIPFELGELSLLVSLDLSYNALNGSIPISFENFTRLTNLYLHANRLSGSILPNLGNPKTLIDLRLFDNFLTGSIPSSLGNYTKLVSLYLHQNQLSGTIPVSLGNVKTLLDLALSGNNLTGSFPEELNNLTMNLETLALGNNKLSGYLPNRICQGGSLVIFSVNNNSFSGPIPSTIKNCSKLIRVRFDGNHITGNISDAFGVYDDLEYIDLSRNNFYGEVSTDWALCRSLTSLKMSNNNLSGVIPDNLGNSRLQEVQLSENYLTGEIPTSLGRLSSLIGLFLDGNRLSGNIPTAFGKLSNLGSLNLAKNRLVGSIPKEIGDCSRLQVLNLSGNYFGDVIPVELGRLSELQVLDLGDNGLVGGLPPQFGGLKMLEILNISHNNFTGLIPSTFVDLSSLIMIDISYNQLEGHVPEIQVFRNAPFEAVENNKGLCGNITGLKNCPQKQISRTRKNIKNLEILIIVPTVCFPLILFVIFGIFIFVRRTNKNENEPPKSETRSPFSVWSYDGKMAYESIIDAVDDFNSKRIVGIGSCGTVYRAELPTGELFAVKKFKNQEPDEFLDAKSFENEIRALTEIRHHNIMKLYGFCSHPRHMFLVYEFIDGGSLRTLLNDTKKAKEFDWRKRLNAIKGVADALSYMHHDCSQPIVHRDLSSNNVLLDSEYLAHLSDFGTAKFLKPDATSNWTSFAGTYGYSAPELAYSMEVNEKCDVYSFGVLTLEVLMGVHPGDLIELMYKSSVKEFERMVVLDQQLLPPTDQVAEVVNFVLELVFACLNNNPRLRPSMRLVSIEMLKSISLLTS